jgi:diguanylate cyclase (GGDEF)-like protein
MPTNAIMKHTATTARRTVLIALIGAAIVVVGIAIERTSFQHVQGAALIELLAAERAASDILLADERLTMSANMAVATGERRWLKRYEDTIPQMEEALRRATSLAPASVAADLKNRTSIANDRLVALERAAFRKLTQGDPKAAHRLLNSGLYRHHKRVLNEGTTRFFESTIGSVHQKLLNLQRRVEITVPLIVVICGLGAFALWRRLNASLKRSQKAFVRAEGTIRSLAMNDPLTGLSNRRALFEHLKSALVNAKRDNAKLALFMIDLDRFKPVNDDQGHLVGDLVLKQVAERLSAAMPTAEVQARYGGDEFVAVLRFEGGDDIVRRIGRQVVETLAQPMYLDGLKLQIGACLGSAIAPTDDTSEEELIRKADLALRHAKQRGSSVALAFDPTMDIDTDARALMETELRMAIASDALVPYFQPIVNMSKGTIRGFEILSRWPHPTRGLLRPDAFIPLAEGSGLIGDLTIAVLRTACRKACELPNDLMLAVNIAPQQILDASLPQKIMAVLNETGFPPERLEVEITENALVSDLSAAKHVISSLKSLGIRVALDDFGTGYSSLCYLSELPIDMIKIDRSFVLSMREREESAKIVTAIIGLGKSLNVSTVAEGVETERDVEFLKANGCTLAQGNYFSRPMSAQAAEALVRSGWTAKRQLVA